MKALHERPNYRKGDSRMLLFASLLEEAQRPLAQLRSSAGQKAPFTRRSTKLGLALIDQVVQQHTDEGAVVSYFYASCPTLRFSTVKLSSHVN